MKEKKKLCAFHCGRQVHRGRRLCREHLEHQRQKMAQYRAERKRMMLCSRCPNPARLLADGTASTLCDACRAHVRAIEARQAER